MNNAAKMSQFGGGGTPQRIIPFKSAFSNKVVQDKFEETVAGNVKEIQVKNKIDVSKEIGNTPTKGKDASGEIYLRFLKYKNNKIESKQ